MPFDLRGIVDEHSLCRPGAVEQVREALAQYLARALAARCLPCAGAAAVDASGLGKACARCGKPTRGQTLCRACRRLPASLTLGAPLIKVMYEGGHPRFAFTDHVRMSLAVLRDDLLKLVGCQQLAKKLHLTAVESLRNACEANRSVRISVQVSLWEAYSWRIVHHRPEGAEPAADLRAGGLGIEMRDTVLLRTKQWLWRIDRLHEQAHGLVFGDYQHHDSPGAYFGGLVRFLASAVAQHVTRTFPFQCRTDTMLTPSTFCELRSIQCERCLGPSGWGLADDERERSVDEYTPDTDADAEAEADAGAAAVVELPPPPWAPTQLRLCLAPDRVRQLRRLRLDDDAVRIILLVDLLELLRDSGELQDGLVDAGIVAPLAEASAHQARQAVEAVQDLIRPMETAEEHEASLEAMRRRDPLVEDELAHAALAVTHVSLQQLATFCNPAGTHLHVHHDALAARVHGLLPAAVDVPERFTAFLTGAIDLALHAIAHDRVGYAPTQPPPPVGDVLRLCPTIRAWRPERGELRLSASQLARTPQVRAVLDALALNAVVVRRLAGNKYALAAAELAALLGVGI